MHFKPLIRRFALPVIAAFALHWGMWVLVLEADGIVMSVLTRSLNWIADHSPAGFLRVESSFWSARIGGTDAALQGLLPLSLGLLIGWLILRKKRQRQSPA